MPGKKIYATHVTRYMVPGEDEGDTSRRRTYRTRACSARMISAPAADTTSHHMCGPKSLDGTDGHTPHLAHFQKVPAPMLFIMADLAFARLYVDYGNTPANIHKITAGSLKSHRGGELASRSQPHAKMPARARVGSVVPRASYRISAFCTAAARFNLFVHDFPAMWSTRKARCLFFISVWK